MLCPCQSNQPYADCCQPFHTGERQPETAEQLMRSRYAAYALQQVDYIIRTTVPAQQPQLNRNELAQWAHETQFLGLTVHQHTPRIGKHHAQVSFTAQLAQHGATHAHHEQSAFVQINGAWYFIAPTVALPSMKSPCICGSGKKFKACCGQFFK